ncbi:ABC transporter permease [Streptomyces litchfieldiae]|uniref:ABC transporter permease n=1 Tax=Streptomyces litchfieldiae TaxID=3075543 RepID=A0ABU2MXX3_9ACTN|nr:ABC transporter permease [Streptomyces sp. DSM 44938]MDT0346496.1 ABC transporter permease [Streptomyces sp. DSM 44938]
MTVPQPAPDNSSAAANGGHDPWAPKPAAEADSAGGGAAAPGRHWGREIREAVLVALPVAAVTGVLLGLLWLWRAPRVPLISDGEAVLLANSEGQQAIGADGAFLLFGLAIGVVTGAVVFVLRRRGGVAVVLGLTAGALLGSWLAWRLGVWLGPTEDIAAHAESVGAGVPFEAPLELGARGVLLGLPFAALLGHLVCTTAWGPVDPPRHPAELPNWREPAAPGAGDE